jgi:predicted ATPase
MRVAFAGTHRTGKTTLVETLSSRLPGYEALEEPYRLLEDEGYEFSDPPGVEDFERQLRRSIEMLAEPRARALFDRCPLDFVAYLQAIDADAELDDWLDDIRASIETLDVIVVVPIETPDRIAVASHEDRRLRERVDEALRTLVLDDPYGLGAATTEVHGSIDERVRQVLRAMAID